MLPNCWFAEQFESIGLGFKWKIEVNECFVAPAVQEKNLDTVCFMPPPKASNTCEPCPIRPCVLLGGHDGAHCPGQPHRIPSTGQMPELLTMTKGAQFNEADSEAPSRAMGAGAKRGVHTRTPSERDTPGCAC